MASDPAPFLASGLARYWVPVVEVVAAGVGVRIEEIREVTDRFATPVAVSGAVGTIEAGTIGATDSRCKGWSVEPFVVRENIARYHSSVAPALPQPTVSGGCYRVEIAGWPNYTLDLTASDEQANRYLGMEAATGLRLVNAIPRVCAPGVLSPSDLGEVQPSSGLVRPRR